MAIMPAGQPAGGGVAAEAETLATGADAGTATPPPPAVGAPAPRPRKNTTPPMATTAAMPRATKSPILPGARPGPVVVVVAARGRGPLPDTRPAAVSDGAETATVCAVAMGSALCDERLLGMGSVIPRRGSRRIAWRSAFQNSPADC